MMARHALACASHVVSCAPNRYWLSNACTEQVIVAHVWLVIFDASWDGWDESLGWGRAVLRNNSVLHMFSLISIALRSFRDHWHPSRFRGATLEARIGVRC